MEQWVDSPVTVWIGDAWDTDCSKIEGRLEGIDRYGIKVQSTNDAGECTGTTGFYPWRLVQQIDHVG